MEKKFEIKGSNTIFKVWGIIVLVFAGLNGIIGIISIIALSIGASKLNSLMYYMNSNTSAAMTGYIIGIVIGLIIGITIQIISGIVLIRDYVKSKGVLTALSVYYFIAALNGVLYFILGIAIGSEVGSGLAVLVILWGIVTLAWNIATGILLIVKQNRAVSGNNTGHINYEKVFCVILEGVNGSFKGQKYRLNVGDVCFIGRDADCHIQLHHPEISHKHCSLSLLPNGKISITDYSKNGTFYGDATLPKGVPQEVRPGGWLALGGADNVMELKLC